MCEELRSGMATAVLELEESLKRRELGSEIRICSLDWGERREGYEHLHGKL